MRRECNASVALGTAMCTFVTISERRGIVYTEHMLVVAAAVAVMEEGAKGRGRGGVLPLETGNVDQSGSAARCP